MLSAETMPKWWDDPAEQAYRSSFVCAGINAVVAAASRPPQQYGSTLGGKQLAEFACQSGTGAEKAFGKLKGILGNAAMDGELV